jgi:hypothetical protein
MKKVYFNIFFQLSALVVFTKFIFFDEVDFNKISLLEVDKLILLIIFSIVIKLLITYLFFYIINIVSYEKINYLDVTSVHLQGGLINQILPGVGHIFRYYKLKLYSNITILRYSTTQFIWSLNSLFVYFFVGLSLGFLVITSYLKLFFYVILIIATFTVILKFSFKFYEFIKKLTLKYLKKKLHIDNLKNLKKLLLKNKSKFILILIGFLTLLILESFSFYLALNFLGMEISFLSSAYIFITSTLLSTLALINFFGFFEIIIALSAAVIMPEIDNILIFAINLRIINLFSLILIIIKVSLLKRILKR